MKTLVAGWFSFELMGASAGDLLARDVACAWLREAGHDLDIALAAPFTGGVDWRSASPADYAQVVFVCGPFGNGPPLTDFLERFRNVPLVGLNLTMLDTLEAWNPFDILIERDSSARAHPDLAFLAPPARVPLVGVVLIDSQPEYKRRDRHETANAALRRLVAARDVAAVPIDTRLDTQNQAGLASAAQIESLLARMDCVVTTRLHGAVLALKNGVPALALDPVAGGAKIRRQLETLGWPVVFNADTLDDNAMAAAFDWCLSEEARQEAARCAARASRVLAQARVEFFEALAQRGRLRGARA
ncbi:MAG: polysaccharide pyruvyl transferase family protein [Gemmataceae bacterium]